MSVSITFISVLAAFCALIYRFLIHPLFFAPLSKLPKAHFSSPLTDRWFWNQRRQKRELRTLYTTHEQHGPIVLLAPNNVSVASVEGLRAIYTAGLEKDPWYREEFMNLGTENLVSMLDHGSHSAQKRIISGLYAKSYILRSPDVQRLSREIVFERVLPLINGLAGAGSEKEGEVNVFSLAQWAGMDFVTAYLFGTANGTRHLVDSGPRDEYFGAWEPFVKTGDVKFKAEAEATCLRMCKAALAQMTNGAASPEATDPVVFEKLYTQLSRSKDDKEDTLIRCASEMFDHIIASHDTTAITITYVFYRLSQNPSIQAALRKELRTLKPRISISEQRQNGRLPPPASLDALPLLDAVLHETLRLHAPAPSRLPRLVPKEGLTLHGYFIPGGTTISSNAYTLHRDAETFPSPLEWRPERWLSSSVKSVSDATEDNRPTTGAPGTEAMRRRFWAFGSGGRMCIGSNFALLALKQLIAAVYTDYETHIVDDTDIEQSDDFISRPEGGRLVVRFRRAESS